MKIRRGNYTIYNGMELAIFSVRYESYLPENEKPYSICYSADVNLSMEGFTKHPFLERYCRDVLLRDLSNAFYVQTFGLYKGVLVEVMEYRPDPSIGCLTTNDKSSIEKHSFLDMSNGKYGKDVKISEIDKLWEERKPSEYNLPMPEGIKEYKELRAV